MMKQLIFIIVLLTISFASLTCDQVQSFPNDYQNDIEVLGQGNFNDMIKCIKNAKTEIKNVIELIKAIEEGSPVVIVKDAIKVIKEAIDAINNCDSLFCYGPTFKKCQEENGAPCQRWGDLVYPSCKDGFTNWLCCVCATECPAGFRDDGLYCAKPEAYGRGAGYPLWDEDKCNNENQDVGGCEKNGALWYPKCKEGFHNVGCCICSPDCPSDFEDIGVSCKKPESYGRGVGYPVSFGLQCLFEKEEELVEFATCTEKKIHLSLIGQDVYSKIESEEFQGYQVAEMLQYFEQYIQSCQQDLQSIE